MMISTIDLNHLTPAGAGSLNTRVVLTNGLLYRSKQLEAGHDLVLRDGVIEGIRESGEPSIVSDATTIDVEGHVVSPGFLDLLNHGSGGFAPEDQAPELARFLPRTGVTWFLPSILSLPWPQVLEAATHVRGSMSVPAQGATIGGVHLEGFFFNPLFGGQKRENTGVPDQRHVEELLACCDGALRMITLAPELPGGLEAVERFAGADVLVSIGHSHASREVYRQARERGLRHATHLMNAMGNSDEQWPAYQGIKSTGLEEHILADPTISADLISDRTGAHVSSEWQRIVWRCLGPDRLCLVTDAMPAAGLPPGSYEAPDGQRIHVREEEDVARLDGGGLFGSIATMDRALRSFMGHTGVALEDALDLATANPARVIGEFATRGSIAKGKAADVVILNESCEVLATFIHGQLFWKSEASSVA